MTLMLGHITQMELLIYGSFRGAISSFLFPSYLLLLAYYLFKRHYVVRKRDTVVSLLWVLRSRVYLEMVFLKLQLKPFLCWGKRRIKKQSFFN